MGILDNITKNTANYSTKSFYFGMPEAEGENRDKYKLSDYFEDYLEILSELKKGKIYFHGAERIGENGDSQIHQRSVRSGKGFSCGLITVKRL